MAVSPDPVCRISAAGIVLSVRLTPKSFSDAIEGVETHGTGCFIKARVTAAPEKGRANAALEKLISGWLNVPRSHVRVSRGGKSRVKSVAVSGAADELEEKYRTAIGTGEDD